MTVDSFKFLPKSFVPMFKGIQVDVDGPVWAPLEKPLDQAKIAVLSSAGIFVAGQESFDMEREKREPAWGDPTWRAIPRNVAQNEVDAAHLHINTDHVKQDIGVAMGFAAFADLEAEGVIGGLAQENYSVMGFQEAGCEVWKKQTGPEIAARIREAEVDALLLAPA